MNKMHPNTRRSIIKKYNKIMEQMHTQPSCVNFPRPDDSLLKSIREVLSKKEWALFNEILETNMVLQANSDHLEYLLEELALADEDNLEYDG